MEYRYISKIDDIVEAINNVASSIQGEAEDLSMCYDYLDKEEIEDKADYVRDRSAKLNSLMADFKSEFEFVKDRIKKGETVIF